MIAALLLATPKQTQQYHLGQRQVPNLAIQKAKLDLAMSTMLSNIAQVIRHLIPLQKLTIKQVRLHSLRPMLEQMQVEQLLLLYLHTIQTLRLTQILEHKLVNFLLRKWIILFTVKKYRSLAIAFVQVQMTKPVIWAVMAKSQQTAIIWLMKIFPKAVRLLPLEQSR